MIKINTSTPIHNLHGEPFIVSTDKKDTTIKIGDVIFGELGIQNDIPLRTSWRLMPQFAKEDTDIELSSEDAKILSKMIEKAAQRPANERLNLVIYGRVLEMLDTE